MNARTEVLKRTGQPTWPTASLEPSLEAGQAPTQVAFAPPAFDSRAAADRDPDARESARMSEDPMRSTDRYRLVQPLVLPL